MGKEIKNEHFSVSDWQTYQRRLKQETQLLKETYDSAAFSSKLPVGGFEIEGWLTDDMFSPVCKNEAFFQAFNDDQLASAELAKFNIELNNTPRDLKGAVFHTFEQALQNTWQKATRVANSIDAKLLMIGILPTAKQQAFCVQNMSNLHRYHVLNKHVLSLRNSHPIELDIAGKEHHLRLQHNSVMLESATTSFQIHMQVPWQQAHHYCNASSIASAPLLAAASNSPYLFGQALWMETRIPVFEQAVNTGQANAPRVNFGNKFIEPNILTCFDENLLDYEVLLPELSDQPVTRFSHLRLHNGTIWRWNRPLIGFDHDGTPHFRIEQRTLPAGPTIVDMVANAVFYYGLVESLEQQCEQGKMPCNFAQAKANFYQAARHGLDAALVWDQAEMSAQSLILDHLLPMAEQGLQHLMIDPQEITHYLTIVANRVQKKQTGADWQRQFIQHYGNNMQAMTQQYWINQQMHQPVSEWTL